MNKMQNMGYGNMKCQTLKGTNLNCNAYRCQPKNGLPVNYYKNIIGMSFRQAQDYLDFEYRQGNIPSMNLRLVWKNGDYLVITADYRTDRINVKLWYDAIIEVDGIY